MLDRNLLVAPEAERSAEDRWVCVLSNKTLRLVTSARNLGRVESSAHEADPDHPELQPHSAIGMRGGRTGTCETGRSVCDETRGKRTFLLAPSHARPVGLLANVQVKVRTVVGQHGQWETLNHRVRVATQVRQGSCWRSFSFSLFLSFFFGGKEMNNRKEGKRERKKEKKKRR